MATMDIFETDAFSVIELTRALENIPFKPAPSRAPACSPIAACARAPLSSRAATAPSR